MRNVKTRCRLKLIGISSLALMTFGAGCTLKSSGSSTLTISLPDQLPQSRSALAAFSGLQSANALTPLLPWSPNAVSANTSSAPAPTLAGYTCFGVNVSGPGIFADPRMSCGPSGNAGVVGGLVPVMNGAQISVDVPSGPSRTIQLFATTSTVGCPDINTILNQMAANGGQVIGVNQPFLIAQTTVDVFNDTDVTLDARGYNPNTTVAMFNSCGGGGTVVPITLAQTGYFPAAAPSPTMAGTFTTPTLTGPTPFTAAQLSTVSLLKPDNGTGLPPYSPSNSVIYAAPYVSTTTGSRAAAQFFWDVTGFNISSIPVIQVQFQIAGGAVGWSGASVAAGLQNTAGTFTSNGMVPQPMPSASPSPNLQWSSIYQVPTSLVVPCPANVGSGTTGKCIVANVESNLLAPMPAASPSPGAPPAPQSMVVVGGAQLTLYPTPPPLGLSVWPKSTTYYAGTQGGGGTNFNFFAQGGIPPYTMVFDGTPAPTPSVSPSPGPGGGGGTMWSTTVVGPHNVTVTDSSVPAHSYSFPFTTVAGLSYPAWTNTAGCTTTGTAVNVGPLSPTIGGTNVLTYSIMGIPPGTLTVNANTGVVSGTVPCNLTAMTNFVYVIGTDATGAQIQSMLTLTY